MIDNRNFKVVSDAKVSAQYHTVSNTDIRLKISVNDEMPHIFEKGRSENKLIEQMELKSIEERFNGGTFVFLNGNLIDYRVAEYNGYIRSDEEIKVLSDVLGVSVSPKSKTAVGGMFNQFRRNSLNGDVFLGGEGKQFDLSVAGLGEGGEFVNKLIHKWSPFDKNVVISLESERLVCANGMVGMSPFVTNQVPIVNRVEEHLELVSVQLEPQINSILKDRFSTMSKQPASVGSMMNAHNTLTDRLKGMTRHGSLEAQDSKAQLVKLKNLVDVKSTLRHVYDNSVFSNKEMANGLKGNLSQFDLFNVLTEGCTHTNGNTDNNNKIQMDINKLVFDELNDKKSVQGEVPLSQESDHKRAFFGK